MPDLNSPQGSGSENQGYTPASFEKRVAAWVGVVYMLILTAAMTYMLYTGTTLNGIAPLLLPPAAVGAGVIVIHRHRKGAPGSNRFFLCAMLILCAAAFLLGLVMGIPALLANFSSSMVSFTTFVVTKS